jgi:peptidoglycan/xylan/chitin deacetylase (PgdA/CDA1 family)
MSTLYAGNTPATFWRLAPGVNISASDWDAAIRQAAGCLPAQARRDGDGIDRILVSTLGEGQFGPHHWRLGPLTRLYYALKPAIPRSLSRLLRRARRRRAEARFPLGWPIEPRYVNFQFTTLRQALLAAGRSEAAFLHFWPDGLRYAFVLTHDIETAAGQEHVRTVARLEETYGFRSSFNFVAEGYAPDLALMDELRRRGFEVGIHGVKHDGKDFRSHEFFLKRARLIGVYLRKFNAVGYRSPLTHRNPEWMQALEIEYDSSFFDSDPHEPIPGGCMSIWPFTIGRFVELPYTLMQDYTLTAVLGEATPRLWLEKVDFIEASCGMALLNSHPDYLKQPAAWAVYEDFLRAMSQRQGTYWHALPSQVARWWCRRRSADSVEALEGGMEAVARINHGAGSGNADAIQISLDDEKIPEVAIRLSPLGLQA